MELHSNNKGRGKKATSIDMSTMVYGKVPPNAKPLEDAVLGAIMLEGKHGYLSAFEEVSGILKYRSFYSEANQIIFRAMESLQHKGMPLDLLSVIEELHSSGELDLVGGAHYVTVLTNTVVSTANIEAHAAVVQQKFIQRELIRISGEIICDAYEDTVDVFDLLDDAENKITGIVNLKQGEHIETMVSALMGVIQDLDNKIANPQAAFGITSGFPSVDDYTFGWQPADLIGVAAFSGVGKTAFALNLLRNAAKAGTPAAMFCLEMKTAQLVERCLSAESEIALTKIRRGTTDVHERSMVGKASATLEKCNIFWDDTGGLSIQAAKRKVRRLKRKHGVKLFIFDYYQLMTIDGDVRGMNRENQLAFISRELKKLAKDEDVTIIVLSQVTEKEIEKRTNKEPKQSDLRETSALGNDCDILILLYRPSYHGIEVTTEGQAVGGETFANFAKNRNGTVGKVKLLGKLHIQKFIDPQTSTPAQGFIEFKPKDESGKEVEYPF